MRVQRSRFVIVVQPMNLITHSVLCEFAAIKSATLVIRVFRGRCGGGDNLLWNPFLPRSNDVMEEGAGMSIVLETGGGCFINLII